MLSLLLLGTRVEYMCSKASELTASSFAVRAAFFHNAVLPLARFRFLLGEACLNYRSSCRTAWCDSEGDRRPIFIPSSASFSVIPHRCPFCSAFVIGLALLIVFSVNPFSPPSVLLVMHSGETILFTARDYVRFAATSRLVFYKFTTPPERKGLSLPTTYEFAYNLDADVCRTPWCVSTSLPCIQQSRSESIYLESGTACNVTFSFESQIEYNGVLFMHSALVGLTRDFGSDQNWHV